MRLLSIDPGTTTGIAHFEDQTLLRTKTVTASGDSLLQKRLHIAAFILDEIVNGPGKLRIACEEPMLLGRANNHMQRLLGMIELVTLGTVQFFHPLTVKKFMGSGKLQKEEMLSSLYEKLSKKSYKILDSIKKRKAYDESDAICTGLLAATFPVKEGSKL